MSVVIYIKWVDEGKQHPMMTEKKSHINNCLVQRHLLFMLPFGQAVIEKQQLTFLIKCKFKKRRQE